LQIQRAKKSRISAAISLAWVSSAKWPASKKWIVAPGISRLKRLGTARQEKRIVLSPNCQETWLVSPEIALEDRVKRDVVLVIAQQVQLNLIGARAGQIEVVE
jgi:hypothetical protein